MPEAQSANSSASVRPIDLDRPWLGLRSFGEEHTGLFFGRQTERNEILRCVDHRHITVLYGRSGLGKTSLIRAGLTRDLLTAGYQPIFHRIRYGPEEATPAIQLIAVLSDVYKAPISQNTDLYVLLHDPALGFCGPFARYKPPVFLLDQFEEVFTLGAEVNSTLKSRRDVLAEVRDVLAILGQNFIPEELAALLETDEDLYARLDQESHAGRVVLSLRDDYVFALDRWRRELPSVGDNRYELLPLTGEKAYLAVAEPGKLRDPEHPIVTAECAIEIVRFVAGDKEQRKLDELVVVPPLLSLICEQLNAYRIKHGREQIEPTFQKDTADEILEDYYQSRFRDRPVELRMLVEEHLLSAEGHRQPVNVDTAERMLEKVCPNNDGRRLLDDLVAERLLTIVEHGSLRRFELTHDILCPIAHRSRDARRELEEKNRLAKEAELAQQRQHEAEASAREAADRATALDAALKKETQARTDADLARATAQAAKERAVASKKAADELIRYMQYDLSKRLGKLGRLGILDAVTARIIKYHEEHPPEPGDEAARDAADRERSVALIQQGDILRDQGHLPEALKAYRDSLEIAERLTKKDPDNTLWQRDLFLSYINVGDVQFAKGDLSSALKSFRDGLAISEKLAKQDPRNADWQRDLSLSYEKVGDVQRSQGDLSGALKSYRESLGMREKLAKQDSSNSDWQRDLSVSYKKVGDVQSAQDDFSGALQSFRHGLGIAEKLAKQDPGNAIWQRDLSLSYEKVGFMQGVQGDFSGALKSYRDGVGILEELAKQDPGHAGWQHGLSAIYNNVGSVQNAQGDHSGALKSYRESLRISEKLVKQDPGNAIWQGDLAWVYWQTGSAWAQAEPNSKNEARAMMEKGRDILRQLKEGRRLTANMQKWLDSIEVDLWKMQENK